MRRNQPRRIAALLFCTAVIGATACGADDDAVTLSQGFCEAKATFDAVSPDTPDEAALRRYQGEAVPLLDRMGDEAPGQLTGAVSTWRDSITEPRTLEEASAAATDEKVSNAKALIGVSVHEQCGFEQAEFVVVDHAFQSAPESMQSGRTSLLLDNRGDALHAIVVFRVNDDVPDGEVLGLIGTDGLETRAAFVNAMPTDGGHKAALVIDLEPGRYIYFDDEHIDEMRGRFVVAGRSPG